MDTFLSKDEQDNTERVVVPNLSQPTFQKFKESNPHLRVCVQHTKNEIEVSVNEFIYTGALKSITLLSPLSTIDKLNKNLLLEIVYPASFLVRAMASACGRQTGEIIRQVANWNIGNGNGGVVIGEQTRFRINAAALPPQGGKRYPSHPHPYYLFSFLFSSFFFLLSSFFVLRLSFVVRRSLSLPVVYSKLGCGLP
jgi:hypothetical protein